MSKRWENGAEVGVYLSPAPVCAYSITVVQPPDERPMQVRFLIRTLYSTVVEAKTDEAAVCGTAIREFKSPLPH